MRRLALFILPATALAQTRIPTPPPPTGTVTGHVFCADTNQPARFAHVSLQAIPVASKAATKATDSFGPPTDTSGAGKVETTLDGGFILTHVKPGTYYVIVDKQGYLGPRSLFSRKQLDDPSPDMLALRAESIPHVVVEANHTETAEVRLERGASISGTVLYDDGSPAAELLVQVLHKDAQGKWVAVEPTSMVGGMITDDRGHFHGSSLLPDDYILEADLSLTSSKTSRMSLPGGMLVFVDKQTIHSSLPFYGKGTAHLSEAESIKLRAGQETPGQDMVIPIAKLHKLTGHVAAGRDAHFINAASLSLVSRDDNKIVAGTDISREDGLFHFDFVPDGDYTLKVTEARDVVWELPAATKENPIPTEEKERTIATFGNTEAPILLRGDQLDTLATISPNSVAPPTPSKPGTKVNASTDPSAPDAPPQSKPEAHPQGNAAQTAASL